MKNINDYNGNGKWSRIELTKLYLNLCKSSKVDPQDIRPMISENNTTTWIYPVMDKIIDLAKLGDQIAIEIVLQLMESDDSMPFGMTLKSCGSRAIKVNSHLLNSDQQKRIIRRVEDMKNRGYTPREFYEYSRLSRMIIRNSNNDSIA